MATFLKNLVRSIYIRYKFPKATVAYSARVSLNTNLQDGVKILKESSLGDCKIGRFTYVGTKCQIINTQIGAFTSIGSEVICGLGTHPLNYVSTYPGFYSKKASGSVWFGSNHGFEDCNPVNIGSDVWIGTRAIIMGGIKVGNGAVIGSGAIVTKDVPPYAIVVGVPAKIIKFRFNEDTIKDLLASKWWDLPESTLRELSKFSNEPLKFLANMGKIFNDETKSV